MMGGNLTVEGISPQPIEIMQQTRSIIVNDLINSLRRINEHFKNQFGLDIWKQDVYVAGSSQHLFDSRVKTAELLKFKSEFSDIDVLVDETLEAHLQNFFVVGKQYGLLTYLGKSPNAMNQISALFYFDQYDQYIQIDFVFVKMDEDSPSEWALFSHSAPLKDVMHGIKGVFHKYLVGSIDFGFARRTKVYVPKKKSFDLTFNEEHPYAFSVAHGLREKFKLVPAYELPFAALENLMERKLTHDFVFRKLERDEYRYTQDLEEIFTKLMRRSPEKGDMILFRSFLGTLELISKLPVYRVDAIYLEFVKRCWGKGAQKLYKDNPDKDRKVKEIAINVFRDMFFALTIHNPIVQDMKDQYYSSY